MNTKEVFDAYFSTLPEIKQKKLRAQADRAEVYEFEEEKGKSVFEMDVDELFEMMLTFNKRHKKTKTTHELTYSSYDQISSIYRAIWNYYIDNVKIIKNPWNDKRMRGVAALERLSEEKERFTFDIIEKALREVYGEYDADKDNYIPKYLECITLLFYCGFADAMEIVNTKEEDVNEKTHDIRLKGRTIHLSDRCFELFSWVHSLNKVSSSKKVFVATSYHGSYFKFIMSPQSAQNLDAKPDTYYGSMIVRIITRTFRQEHNYDINYRKIYLLGFYDYIKNKVGDDRARELATSVRNPLDAQELMKYAREYGIEAENVTYIKKNLRPYI